MYGGSGVAVAVQDEKLCPRTFTILAASTSVMRNASSHYYYFSIFA